jgi:hypothetical protein
MLGPWLGSWTSNTYFGRMFKDISFTFKTFERFFSRFGKSINGDMN